MALRRTFEEIELVAQRLRQTLRIDGLLCPDLLEILENKLAAVFPGFEFIRVLDVELPEAPAKADCSTKKITAREILVQQAIQGSGYARMTLAHEIGHIALGHSGTRYRKSGLNIQAETIADVRREESEAKRFAAVFLAPTHLAESCKSPEEIEDRFGISHDAAEIRKSELDAHARRKAGVKRPLPAGAVSFLEEARRRGYKVTSLD